jgi:hypothetical protein
MFKKIISKLSHKKYDFTKDIIVPNYFRKRIKCPFYGFDENFHNSNCHDCALGGTCHLIKFDDPDFVKFETDPINNCFKFKYVNLFNLIAVKVFPNEYNPLDTDNWEGIPFYTWVDIITNPYRTMLIWFVIQKHRIIKRRTGIDYVDKEDIDELMLLEDSKCERLLQHILKTHKYNQSFSDSQICPWCTININCYDCGYGKRHGVCRTRTDRYSKIIKKIKSISSLNDMKGLILIMRNRFNRLSKHVVEL